VIKLKAFQHRHIASSRPWIDSHGDGTTGTLHKSHSKRHPYTKKENKLLSFVRQL